MKCGILIKHKLYGVQFVASRRRKAHCLHIKAAMCAYGGNISISHSVAPHYAFNACSMLAFIWRCRSRDHYSTGLLVEHTRASPFEWTLYRSAIYCDLMCARRWPQTHSTTDGLDNLQLSQNRIDSSFPVPPNWMVNACICLLSNSKTDATVTANGLFSFTC